MPLLVFANKQDLEMALEDPEVMSTLELESITNRNWNIQACSAVSQQGLNEGMEWLIGLFSTQIENESQREVYQQRDVVELRSKDR